MARNPVNQEDKPKIEMLNSTSVAELNATAEAEFGETGGVIDKPVAHVVEAPAPKIYVSPHATAGLPNFEDRDNDANPAVEYVITEMPRSGQVLDTFTKSRVRLEVGRRISASTYDLESLKRQNVKMRPATADDI